MKQRLRSALQAASAVLLLVPIISLGQVGAVCVTSDCSSNSDTNTLFGQTQAYDVLLRGNGEAVVNARVTLSNNNKSPVSKLNYSVVSGQLGDVTVFQQVSCIDLPIIKPANSTSTSGVNTTSPLASPSARENAPPITVATTDIPECYPAFAEHPLSSSSSTEQNSTTSQLPYYYPSSNSTYKKVSVSKTGNSFNLTLPWAVKNNKSTTVVMAYDVAGVARKSLGVFHYNFKTLKAAAPVSDVTVAVSVDENYLLADAANGKVNYHPIANRSAISSSLQAGTAQAANGATSADVNNYVSSIGGNGSVTKHASSLAPQETFTVAGRFASSTFLLNWPRMVLHWAIAIAILAALIYSYFRQRRRLQRQTPNNQTTNHSEVDTKKGVGPVEQQSMSSPAEQAVTVSANSGKVSSINLQAVPFYGLVAAFKRHLQERQIRPMFFAWLCGILSVGLVAGVLEAFSTLSQANNYTTSGANNILLPGLYLGLAAVGFLGFLFFSIGLPILYAGSFKRAMRIFMHLMIFFIVVEIVLITLVVRNGNQPVNNYGCGGGVYQGSSVGNICPATIQNDAAQSTTK